MNKLLPEDRIEACKEFFSKFNRVPKIRETMRFRGMDFKIGQFIYNAKKGCYNDDIRHEIKCIFGPEIMNINTNVQKINIEHKLNACVAYKMMYNTVPNYYDKILINNKPFAIGRFIKSVRDGGYSYLRPRVEQIFGNLNQDGIVRSYVDLPINIKIKACKDFYNIYHRCPKINEKIELSDNTMFNIGSFVHNVKYGHYKTDVKQEINNIFESDVAKITDDEYLELIIEYFNLNHQLPNENEPVLYKNIDLTSLLHDIEFKGLYPSIHDKVMEMVNQVKLDKVCRLKYVGDWIKTNFN